MKTLCLVSVIAALALLGQGCAVYAHPGPYYGHVHVHDGYGHCSGCGWYYWQGGWYQAAPHGWAVHYGAPAPGPVVVVPAPAAHIHVHDGYGRCHCGHYYHHGVYYTAPPPGWSFYYRHR